MVQEGGRIKEPLIVIDPPIVDPVSDFFLRSPAYFDRDLGDSFSSVSSSSRNVTERPFGSVELNRFSFEYTPLLVPPMEGPTGFPV
jgi:hypothetical protein